MCRLLFAMGSFACVLNQTLRCQRNRVRQFKLSRDPEFIPKLRDIVGLYVDPPAHAVVSRMLGHKRPSMTLRYAHVGDRETEAAAECIGTAISRALGGRDASSSD